MQNRLAYVSFDTVPAPKGAAIHIEAFVRALAARFGGVDLVTVAAGAQATPPIERWPGVLHTEFPADGRSLIDRVLYFRQFLSRWLRPRRFEAIQFRSIFEGLPLVRSRGRARLIFEVNGLPSVELKYRYPAMVDDRELVRKIVSQEKACFDAADLIVTPSGVTREYLISARGVAPLKLRVIPNGVDLDLFSEGPLKRAGGFSLLYFGTLAAWQGVELAIRALAQIRQEADATLTIIGAGTAAQRDALSGLAAKLDIANHVVILQPVPQRDLAAYIHASDAVLAPLSLNDRNVTQGCCPLKILEAMAGGSPVIASDLPVVRELGCDGAHVLLVKPGSVDQIAHAALRINSNRELGRLIARQARAHVEANYSWDRACNALVSAYEELGINPSSTA